MPLAYHPPIRQCIHPVWVFCGLYETVTVFCYLSLSVMTKFVVKITVSDMMKL